MPQTCECPHCRGFRKENSNNTSKRFLESLKALEKTNAPNAK